MATEFGCGCTKVLFTERPSREGAVLGSIRDRICILKTPLAPASFQSLHLPDAARLSFKYQGTPQIRIVQLPAHNPSSTVNAVRLFNWCSSSVQRAQTQLAFGTDSP